MIVTIGDAALDVFVRPHGPILVGSDVAGTVRMLPGGSAANAAVWAARLGAEAGFIGAVGPDPAGEVLHADFTSEGVQAHLVRVVGTTCMVAVIIDDSGERAMIPDRGAAAMLSAEMILPEWLPAGSVLHVPSYGLFSEPNAGAIQRAVALCRAAGGRISVDTSSVGPLRAYGRASYLALLEDLTPDILFANADEGTLLAGTADPQEGTAFLRRFAGIVIWKLGAEGAVARADRAVKAAGVPVRAVDSTGAGDAFAAASLTALERGRPLTEAMLYANSLAAQVVQLVGARPIVTTATPAVS